MSFNWLHGTIGLIIVFFVGAWVASKYPTVNIIARVTG